MITDKKMGVTMATVFNVVVLVVTATVNCNNEALIFFESVSNLSTFSVNFTCPRSKKWSLFSMSLLILISLLDTHKLSELSHTKGRAYHHTNRCLVPLGYSFQCFKPLRYIRSQLRYEAHHQGY